MLGCPRYSEGAQAARLRGACGVGVSDLQRGVALAAKRMGRLQGMQGARLGWLWDGHPIVVIGIEQVDCGGVGISGVNDVH